MERTAELVHGTWAKYFENLNMGYWTPETAAALNGTFNKLYGGFHETALGKKRKVLELGVGSGAIAIPLTNKGFQVTGLDNDREVMLMVKSNKEKFAQNPETLQLLMADLYKKLPFANQAFDACVSYGLLEHFLEPDLIKLMEEQFRVASIIIAMVPIKTKNTLKTYQATGNAAGETDANGIFRRFLSKREWEKFFTGINLQIIDSKKFTNTKENFGSWDMAVWALKNHEPL